MRHFSTRVIIAGLTFLVGIAGFTIWLYSFNGIFETQQYPAKSSLAPNEHMIYKAEAVQLAESFVIANGYTSLSPMEDKSKLSYETWDDSPPGEGALQRRRNTIESKAYGVLYDEKNGWTVVFRYNQKNEMFKDYSPKRLERLKEIGRAVTMDAYGGKMRVEHEDYPLSEFQRVK